MQPRRLCGCRPPRRPPWHHLTPLPHTPGGTTSNTRVHRPPAPHCGTACTRNGDRSSPHAGESADIDVSVTRVLALREAREPARGSLSPVAPRRCVVAVSCRRPISPSQPVDRTGAPHLRLHQNLVILGGQGCACPPSSRAVRRRPDGLRGAAQRPQPLWEASAGTAHTRCVGGALTRSHHVGSGAGHHEQRTPAPERERTGGPQGVEPLTSAVQTHRLYCRWQRGNVAGCRLGAPRRRARRGIAPRGRRE